MAYKPKAPPDKAFLPGMSDISADSHISKNTGYTGYSGYRSPAIDRLLDEPFVAVLIDSTILGAPIWFALRNGWKPDPGDATPVFYASELPALRQKTPEQLRSAFGGGMVRS
jgi:hypothetical protein